MSTEAELYAWLVLDQVPGLGSDELEQLTQLTSNNASALFDLEDQQLRQLGWKAKQVAAFRNPDKAWIDDALHWLQSSPEHAILTYRSDTYPKLLQQLFRPPVVLYCKGNVSLLDEPQLAIVGSRNPTPTGHQFAFDIAAQLVAAGLVVTSGLALGIDGWAHKGALEAKGKTIAVLGSGLAKPYPRRNVGLSEQICNGGGCLISEFAPQLGARAEHFPRRNRIISGLSLGTLVVEAAIRSGSLITARCALEQGRDVFAVPGSIFNPLAQGCHYLIKQGAKLVEGVEDILEEYQNLALGRQNYACSQQEKSDENGLAKDILLGSVEFEVTSIDVIAQRSGLPVTQVLAQLLEYELRGLVAAVPGGYVKLRGK
ncbi:DNA-processing protein DprA [Bowmanella yangjiangensis]|uniref:DNA-processing protein DprA n=1 Tax=Bowmanella yangjiangensis TaxID=2811230 RepID=A0ABS3CXK0_9ALTE|nr:DNA-processing protein DprA [Bowmanella yangjiangensis]MBN7821857.1 DNA-processing protein DprA [Bowmanella yangjiangensis]